MTKTMRGTTRRSLAVAIGLSAALVGGAVLRAQQVADTAKVAVIDVRRILTESVPGREALNKLRQLAEARQADIEEREKVVSDLKARLEAGRMQLSEDKQDEMEQELQGMIIDLGRAQDDARRELEERQVAEFGAIEDRIMPLIREIGTELEYTLIFNKFEDSGLLFAAPGTDITDLVLQRFDALSENGAEG